MHVVPISIYLKFYGQNTETKAKSLDLKNI